MGFLTNDGTALGYGNVPIDDDRCESHWMYLLQFLWGQVFRIPLPSNNLVRDLEFFLPA
jgi:hypothetical protein